MPRYRSPSRTPSPSRSPSRSLRGRRAAYTDGVYTPSTSDYSRSPSPPRGRSRGRSYSRGPSSYSRSRSRSRLRSRPGSYSRSRSRSRSPSRSSTVGRSSRSTKEKLKQFNPLDISGSTRQEKTENVMKTGAVMLGIIGVASIAAHKLWPKGITYGEKEDWEHEQEEKKDKIKDALDGKVKNGKATVRGGEGKGDGGGRGDDRDRSRERRMRYIKERARREREGRGGGGGGGGAAGGRRRLALPAAAATGAAAGAAYYDDRKSKEDRSRDPDRDRYDGYDRGYDYSDPRDRPGRYADDAPPPLRAVSKRRVEQYTAPPPPPPATFPPRFTETRPEPTTPLVAPADPSRERGRDLDRRYYVDSETVVIPSSGEREYVIRRDAPLANRTTIERDGTYYR